MPTEAQRARVDADLDNIIMSSGTDAEIARDGVSSEYVRERRRIRRQDLYTVEIRALAEELARVLDRDDVEDVITLALGTTMALAVAQHGREAAAVWRSVRRSEPVQVGKLVDNELRRAARSR